MEPIIEGIHEFIVCKGLFKKGDRVLLSLSAGKDSMFLLHCINMLRDEMGIDAGIFHLNHMLRGDESDRDEDLLRSLGERFGMATHFRRHDFHAGRAPGISLEEYARNIRYQMLEKIAVANGYSVIATAHTKDDQVETVLMRIFTGTGIHGLQGILPRRGNIIRPLLSVAAADIYDYLRSHDIEWREDSTNTDRSYARNYIRHEIVPRVREKFTMADDSILSLGEIAGETISMIDGLIVDALNSFSECNDGLLYIDADKLKYSFPVFSHALSSLIRRHFNHHVNRNMIREIYMKYLVDKANINLYVDRGIIADKVYRNGKSWLVIRRGGKREATIHQWEYCVNLNETQEQKLYIAEIGLSVTIKIADYRFFEKFHKNQGYIFVTLENNEESIYIRNRRKGDVIKTERGTKKVKELFIEKKLDKASKERVPLLVAGNTVLACMTGFIFDTANRIAADFLVDKNSKKVVAVFKNQ